jgi:hypothetical protein
VDERPRRRQLRALPVGVALFVVLAACSGGKSNEPWPAPMPLARTEVAGASWHGDIAVVGGLTADGAASDRADLYGAFTNRWGPLPHLPIALHHTAVALLDRLYVVGGYTMRGKDWVASDRAFSLGHGEPAWREEPSLPAGRAAHAAVSLNGTLIAVGGVVGGTATNTTVVFSPDRGWRDGPPLAKAREHLAAAVANGRVYAIAGRVGGQNFVDVESWDGAEGGAWRAEPPLNDSRGGIGASTMDGRPCVAGGEQAAGTIASIECLEGGKWRRVAKLAHPRHGLVVVTVGSRLHVIGGGQRPGLTVSAIHEALEL